MTANQHWVSRIDLMRPHPSNFDDLGRIVANNFELYSRLSAFLAPWNAKQIGSTFPYQVPEREQLRHALGSIPRHISPQSYGAIIEATEIMVQQTRGKRQLITPHITTHHSAQFQQSTFTLKKKDDTIQFKDSKQSSKNLYELTLYGADNPVYLSGLTLRPELIKFLIIRPKMGKLGIPNLSLWEVLLFTHPHRYLLDHTDSNLNPRWSGIL